MALQNSLNEPVDPEQGLAEPGYKITGSACRIRDLPAEIRPREAVERVGVENASDDVLLSLLLRMGTKGINVVDLSRGLLRRYGSLTAMASATVADLAATPGVGTVKAQIIKAALELGGRVERQPQPKAVRIQRPEDVFNLLKGRALTLEREIFWVLLLDTRNVIKCRPLDVTAGILDASVVHPREVFREAIRSAAAAIVLAHNHPSGDPSPSGEDLKITRQLVDAGTVVDIKVLDHVILGRRGTNHQEGYLSLREAGLVKFA